ncbi:YfiR family protein [Thalassotalea sp. PLHSN55]|uniref:YfiR family protein n=1 Tax=Thalassotalea sp. PLHSN55 TaxID=3435888 RepID=UPI003F8331D5
MMITRCLFIIFLIVMAMPNTHAHSSEREYALKAGLLYNFALYSQNALSAHANHSNYVMCSSSASFVDIAKKNLADKKIKERHIQIEHVNTNQLSDSHCDAIFFTDNTSFEQYKSTPAKHLTTLLVGESADFIDLGGHINFIVIGSKIRFEINPEQLKENGIKLSSRVIRLGKIKKVNNS